MSCKIRLIVLLSSFLLLFNSVFAQAAQSFRTIQPVESVKEFDDIRWKDLSKLELSEDIVRSLTFNEETIWPQSLMTVADQLIKKGMNPGLGIRKLHEQGITGKGVNVAIIDQPLIPDHPEFAGKIVAYYDTGCEDSVSSMHGPAVTSLLVGTNCGVAPDARVYYAAAPSWKRDAAYYAKALDWIIEQNAALPVENKIRVVSVSAAPSGSGSPFTENNQMWDEACRRAEVMGILVLDCTSHHGFIGPCCYDIKAPDSLRRCRPGFGRTEKLRFRSNNILVPCSPRTTAEQYEPNEFNYQYCGTGGLSWSIPYCAGVLALGWQAKPELDAEEIRELLSLSAYLSKDGGKIIHPRNFIRFVQNPKLAERIRKAKAARKEAETAVSQNPVGSWVSVDFVDEIEDFVPGQKQWSGDLFLKKCTFYKNGTTSTGNRWKNGWLFASLDSKIRSKFLIKKIKGETYLFFPWLSGDVTIRGQTPCYYVLKKR